ncbi:MAG: S8 family serine peptidase [Saprospiraceae bacterium]|nr:S8 family serine peptidase [Saprospiraceae bacterium]
MISKIKYLLAGIFISGILPLLQGQNSTPSTSLLVKFKSTTDSELYINSLNKRALAPGHIRMVSARKSIYKLSYNGQKEMQAAREQLESDPRVETVVINHKLTRRGGTTTPNDPLFSQQWNLDRIGLTSLWDRTTGGLTPCGDTIVVAVFDFGFDAGHQDMQDIMWHNKDEVPNNGFDDDDNGYTDDYAGLNLDTGNDRHEVDVEYHGTSVSSVVTANTNNSLGLAGVNWHVKLLIVSSEEKDQALAVEAYEYIRALRKKYNDTGGLEGAYVVAVNNSWGQEGLFEEDFQLMCDMYNDLGEVGIISVGSTENDQVNTDVFGDIPSDCSSDYLIIVTNTDRDDALAVGGFGKENVDLGAPGEQIKVAGPENTYIEESGTSYSAPHVAGAIGLIYSLEEGTFCDNARLDPTQTILNLKRYILDGVTVVPTLDGRTVSGGRLNLGKTVDMVTSTANSTIEPILVFPNPARSFFDIEIPQISGVFNLIITDVTGKLIITQTMPASNDLVRISTRDWSAGTYFLRIKGELINAYQIVVKM